MLSTEFGKDQHRDFHHVGVTGNRQDVHDADALAAIPRPENVYNLCRIPLDQIKPYAVNVIASYKMHIYGMAEDGVFLLRR